MQLAFGVSSNGRTRDFGSLYHGSNPCAPTTLRVCDASGGKPERNSSRKGVPHEVLTKCGRRIYIYYSAPRRDFFYRILDEITLLV